MVQIFTNEFKKKIDKGFKRANIEFNITTSKGIAVIGLLASGMFWFFLIQMFSKVFFSWFLHLAGNTPNPEAIGVFLSITYIIYFAYIVLRFTAIIAFKEPNEIKSKYGENKQ